MKRAVSVLRCINKRVISASAIPANQSCYKIYSDVFLMRITEFLYGIMDILNAIYCSLMLVMQKF